MNTRGFTIFFATLVAGLALAIGIAIYDITARELDLSATAYQSQYAIYAADTGAECALYWDNKCALGWCVAGSAFPTSTDPYSPNPPANGGAVCEASDITVSNFSVTKGASSATTSFTVQFNPQPYCASVVVSKYGNPSQTTVVSHGYNTYCPPTTVYTTRLERALQVTY